MNSGSGNPNRTSQVSRHQASRVGCNVGARQQGCMIHRLCSTSESLDGGGSLPLAMP